MARIQLSGLNQFYGDVHVICDLNLVIEDGELLVLVGPSGCGKSTLLRLISGLDEAANGDVIINNRLVNNIPTKDRDVAMMFQNHMLYPQKTAFENIAFSLVLQRLSKLEITRQVSAIAELLEITDVLDRRPRQMSGGEKQRVAMGRALIRNPQVFLLDEPLSNLDAKLREQMRTQIKKIHRKLNTTMVFVTHDQLEAMTMADRLAVMNNGQIEQIGTPGHIYDTPATLFVAQFFGTPAINLFCGKLKKYDEELSFCINNEIKLQIPKNRVESSRTHIDQDVVLAVRPEHISIGFSFSDSASFAMVGSVIQLERTGMDSIVTLEYSGQEIRARMQPGEAVEVGIKTNIFFNLNKVHLFEKDTGVAI